MDKDGKENRIKARDTSGRLIAWLVPVGHKRLNHPRAYSDLGAIMQKLHKIGQYTNSEVMAAEANSKFAVVVEQEKESSGINPIKNLPGLARGLQEALSDIPEAPSNNTEVDKLKNTFKRVASALAIFMPKGQKLSSFDTKRPNVNFTSFLDGSMKYICAAFEIPFEIALMVFSNNFSASRASLKMFEVILEHKRKRTIIDYFYSIVYEQMFELECLKGNIQAPKYLELKNDDGYLDNAYTKAKFVGLKIPHIDEVKEVNAVLSKLKGGLSTFEQALQSLGISTDFDSMLERRKIEEEKIRAAGLSFETLFAPDNGNSNDDDTEKDKSFKK
jgi:capsid protein